MSSVGSDVAKPVLVVTDSDLYENGGSFKLSGNVAIRVRGDDTKKAAGHTLVPVYIVDDNDLYENGGSFKIKPGDAIQVMQLPMTGKSIGNVATPVYLTNPSWIPLIPTTNLMLWLKSDTSVFQQSDGTVAATGNGDVVGYWTDLSGGGNHYTQATTAQKPTVETNQINGLPTITSDGSDDTLAHINSLSLLSPGSNKTVFIVCKQVSGSVQTTVFAVCVGNLLGESWTLTQGAIDNNDFIGFGSQVKRYQPRLFSTAEFRIVSSVQTGTNSNLITSYVNGSPGSVWVEPNTSLSESLHTASAIYSGKYAGYSHFKIAEIIVYNTNISTDDHNIIGNYLANRYNLSWSNL